MDEKTKKDLINKGSKVLRDSGVDIGDVASGLAKNVLGGKDQDKKENELGRESDKKSDMDLGSVAEKVAKDVLGGNSGKSNRSSSSRSSGRSSSSHTSSSRNSSSHSNSKKSDAGSILKDVSDIAKKASKK